MRWFSRSTKKRKSGQPARDSERFRRLPRRVDPHKTKGGRGDRRPPDLSGGDDFITRYGDPFD